ncbi:MAG: Uncharacterized protein G01um101472_160 [Parcubacteria group bacterium Gr01-1014_72]|nr:MAG: Uncharacterized protein G01um101472_160 [Parcubacteria group bacterium Gr01-1014_72]
MKCHIDGGVRHLDVGSPHPGGGENITSLLEGNFKVINKLKTVEAKHVICVSQVPGGTISPIMYASAVGKIGVKVDHAYLAGLIDGDGCIMATIERHSEKKFGFRVRVEVKITQKESDLLIALRSFYRIGVVRGNRTTFDWIIRDKNHVSMILNLIAPYTKAKLKQVEYAHRILHLSDGSKNELIKMARLADALSKFNVRSKNRRLNYASMIKIPISSND